MLDNLHHSRVEALNAAWAGWGVWDNREHRPKGLHGDCPAEHYVRSPRQPTPEDLEMLLVHEESRKVTRTGHISYYGQFYRVPDRYIGRRVWAILKGDTLRVECSKEVIDTHQTKPTTSGPFPKTVEIRKRVTIEVRLTPWLGA